MRYIHWYILILTISIFSCKKESLKDDITDIDNNQKDYYLVVGDSIITNYSSIEFINPNDTIKPVMNGINNVYYRDYYIDFDSDNRNDILFKTIKDGNNSCGIYGTILDGSLAYKYIYDTSNYKYCSILTMGDSINSNKNWIDSDHFILSFSNHETNPTYFYDKNKTVKNGYLGFCLNTKTDIIYIFIELEIVDYNELIIKRYCKLIK